MAGHRTPLRARPAGLGPADTWTVPRSLQAALPAPGAALRASPPLRRPLASSRIQRAARVRAPHGAHAPRVTREAWLAVSGLPVCRLSFSEGPVPRSSGTVASARGTSRAYSPVPRRQRRGLRLPSAGKPATLDVPLARAPLVPRSAQAPQRKRHLDTATGSPDSASKFTNARSRTREPGIRQHQAAKPQKGRKAA